MLTAVSVSSPVQVSKYSTEPKNLRYGTLRVLVASFPKVNSFLDNEWDEGNGKFIGFESAIPKLDDQY